MNSKPSLSPVRRIQKGSFFPHSGRQQTQKKKFRGNDSGVLVAYYDDPAWSTWASSHLPAPSLRESNSQVRLFLSKQGWVYLLPGKGCELLPDKAYLSSETSSGRLGAGWEKLSWSWKVRLRCHANVPLLTRNGVPHRPGSVVAGVSAIQDQLNKTPCSGSANPSCRLFCCFKPVRFFSNDINYWNCFPHKPYGIYFPSPNKSLSGTVIGIHFETQNDTMRLWLTDSTVCMLKTINKRSKHSWL